MALWRAQWGSKHCCQQGNKQQWRGAANESPHSPSHLGIPCNWTCAAGVTAVYTHTTAETSKNADSLQWVLVCAWLTYHLQGAEQGDTADTLSILSLNNTLSFANRLELNYRSPAMTVFHWSDLLLCLSYLVSLKKWWVHDWMWISEWRQTEQQCTLVVWGRRPQLDQRWQINLVWSE